MRLTLSDIRKIAEISPEVGDYRKIIIPFVDKTERIPLVKGSGTLDCPNVYTVELTYDHEIGDWVTTLETNLKYS